MTKDELFKNLDPVELMKFIKEIQKEAKEEVFSNILNVGVLQENVINGLEFIHYKDAISSMHKKDSFKAKFKMNGHEFVIEGDIEQDVLLTNKEQIKSQVIGFLANKIAERLIENVKTGKIDGLTGLK